MPQILGRLEGDQQSTYEAKKVNPSWYIEQKEFTLIYVVLADNITQTDDDIRATPFLPQIGTAVQGAWCKTISPKEVASIIHPITGVSTMLWHVEETFSSEMTPEGEQENPTVRWFGEVEEEHLQQDAITGDPIQTVPGEPIIIMTPRILPVLEVTRVEAYPFDPNTLLNYSHKVNASEFYGAPEGTALMMPMDVREQKDSSGGRVVIVTYRVKFKMEEDQGAFMEDTWKARVLHHGFKYFPFPLVAGQDPVVNKDKFGQPVTTNLRQDGTKTAVGETPWYLEFNRYQKIDFNILNLGPYT